MTEGQKPFWIAAAVGAVIIFATAPFAIMFWKTAKAERALIQSELAALNSKIDKTNEALAKIQKTAALDSTAKELQRLNSTIKSTNDALAGVQKVSLKDITEKLDGVNAEIKAGNEALTEIKKATSLDGVTKELGLLDAEIKGVSNTLADVKKVTSLEGVTKELSRLDAQVKNTNDTLADIKKAASAESDGEKLDQLSAGIKANSDALAEIQKTSLNTGHEQASHVAGLENAVGDLRKKADEDAAAHVKLAADIAKMQAALNAPPAPGPNRSDIVGSYGHARDATEKAQNEQFSLAAAPIMIRFEKIGSPNDNGQDKMIIQKLKGITKNRKSCSISVAGYTDTLGGDKTNLVLSKKRAHMVAGKLRVAFADDHFPISESGWGERRLLVWTPNNVANATNRRVEVRVKCTPE